MEFMLKALSFANAVDEIGVVNAIVRTMLQNSVKENHATRQRFKSGKFFQNEVSLSELSPLVIR